MQMSFLNLEELRQAVQNHQQFNHQIKGKRIRKELENLQAYHNQHQITFKKYMISAGGLSFFIELKHQHRMFDFEIFLDFDYPFNRPKIFYIHDSSPYAFCLDLLDIILENGNWGPSKLLNSIFDDMPKIEALFKENENLKANYQIIDIYPEDLLQRHKVEVFDIQEYQWKYMIKSTFERKIGLTKEHFLKFTRSPEGLKLQSVIKIKDIKQANASISHGKFKLDLTCNGEDKPKLYFGGKEEDIQRILYFMNPIQVTERKLSKPEKESYSKQQVEEMIRQYSQLIQFYSLRDPEKTKKYVGLVQDLIKKNYQGQPILKQEIQT